MQNVNYSKEDMLISRDRERLSLIITVFIL